MRIKREAIKMKTIKALGLAFIFAGYAFAMENAPKRFGNRSGEELRTYLGEELCGAARWGDKVRMKYLIEGGADVNYEKDTGFSKETPLSEAVSSGNKKAVELLIKRGANLFWHGHYRSSILSSTDTNSSLAELIVEKMLSIPTLEQKMGIYTFMHCLKCMYPRSKYAQFKDVFKDALRRMIQEENAPKVLAEINGLLFYKQKECLLKKYFPEEAIPEEDGDFSLCGGPMG